MKLATFNLNGIKTRLPQLLDWLVRQVPDVVCLKELGKAKAAAKRPARKAAAKKGKTLNAIDSVAAYACPLWANGSF